MKKVGAKVKPFLIPFIFFAIIFTAFTMKNIKIELMLPDEGWSRSLPIATESFGEVKPVFQEQNGAQHVYVPKEDEVMSFTVTDNLKVTNKKTIPLSIPSPQNFWVKGNEYVFVKNKQLIHFDGKKENILDQDVYGMDSNPNNIIYFKEHELFKVNIGYWDVQPIKKVDEQLKSVALNSQSNSFISVGIHSSPTKQVKAMFYESDNQSHYKSRLILDKDEALNENHFSFYFIENGKDLTIYYTLFKNSNGGKTYTVFQGMNQLGAKKDWVFNKMTFLDKNGVKLENPKYIEYGVDENKSAKILFTTRALRSNEKEAVNVYEARPDGDIWLTELRSTTNHQSMYANWLGDDSIMWMNLIGNKEFTFSGASTKPDVIEKSLALTKEDFKQAASATILSLFQGLIFAMSSIYWITPAVLFAIIIYIAKIKQMEDEDKRVMYTILALFLGVQIIFIQKLFNTHYYMYAPDFLTFSGSSFAIPIVLALLSGAAVWFGRKQDWSMLTSICYFAVLNTFFLSLVVGPYMF
ncbi:hypothetical protein AWM68_01685 [Fictibacillus phosphorivorans]|uniref:Uncharacterized protein n=1 Tax=Fictibacillus phosphorivorans TaxID=1221500 RepID=A0A165P554_9BACL|nr:hypothetical protein [Fictibacillus phosphorivorans]KZE69003.1 hypothetical protein AWM68_01685 [Fictibacillus phosphorivorans]